MSVFAFARAPENRLARMFFAAAAAMLLLSTIATFAPPLGAQTECSLSVSFDNARLLNNGVDTTAGPFAIDLAAGTYTVIVVSHDTHDLQPNIGTQPNEQFRLVLDSGYASPLTNDIPDDVNTITSTFTGQEIGASTSITLEHARIGIVNSVNPLSVCFVDEGPADAEEAAVDPCDATSDGSDDGSDSAAADESCTEEAAESCDAAATDGDADAGTDADAGDSAACPTEEATADADCTEQVASGDGADAPAVEQVCETHDDGSCDAAAGEGDADAAAGDDAAEAPVCPAEEAAADSCDAAAGEGDADAAGDAGAAADDAASTCDSEDGAAAGTGDAVDTEVEGAAEEAAAGDGDQAEGAADDGAAGEGAGTDAATTDGDDAGATGDGTDAAGDGIGVEVRGAVQLPAAAQVDTAAQVDAPAAQTGAATGAVAQAATGDALAATGAGDVVKILLQMSIVLMALGALCTRWVRYA